MGQLEYDQDYGSAPVHLLRSAANRPLALS